MEISVFDVIAYVVANLLEGLFFHGAATGRARFRSGASNNFGRFLKDFFIVNFIEIPAGNSCFLRKFACIPVKSGEGVAEEYVSCPLCRMQPLKTAPEKLFN